MSALESLLFAKYQMYRNVYWHHAVRSATCMFKRAVRAGGAARRASRCEAVARGHRRRADGAAHHPGRAASSPPRSGRAGCYKRALDLPASDVPRERAAWVADDPGSAGAGGGRRRRARSGCRRASCCSTFPRARRCSAWTCRSAPEAARIERLTDAGRAGQLGLPRVADELYRSARRLRVFVASMPARSLDGLLELMTWPAEEVTRRMADEVSLV